ncbi:60S acidic ribosomal protein P2-like [Gracilinanus agilis]|uniref:60S acidic ribosomal protein P2-like n=1 Tax=Gracilinanus agilis TaxID=191870 RepID=UPI001CFD2483|nr:60S acidic ribosomal protein P2-like [Gracilinanus agilis]
MHYVAPYLLAVLGSNDSSNSKDLKKILDSISIETNEEWLKVIGKFSSKSIGDLIRQGSSKLASMPRSGGGGEGVVVSEEFNDEVGFGLFFLSIHVG